MKKFARLFIQYKYQMSRNQSDGLWTGDGNIGDCIQNLAVENIYKKIGISPNQLSLINRDELPQYCGEKVKLVMQGWFANSYNTWPFPISKNINPIFIGFHLNSQNHTRDKFIQDKVHQQIMSYQPIGCRDRGTRDFLRSIGVDAYFSGCLTLTFDKRDCNPNNGKIFVVDVTDKTYKKLPKSICNHADFSITHLYYWKQYPITYNDAIEFEERARQILEKYKTEAKLVITSRIHVAMPCIAMGIPVIFIHENPDNERFDVLRGIIPLYKPSDIRYVNWHPKPTDIDSLKQAIIDNAVDKILGQNSAQTLPALEKITNGLNTINYLPIYVRIWRHIRKIWG